VDIANMIDTTHPNVAHIPVNTAKVAGYVTGTPDIKWTPPDWARFPKSGHVRIDQQPGYVEFMRGAADVADIESGIGNVTKLIGEFITAAKARASKGWGSWPYIDRADWDELKAAVKIAGLVNHVEYWLADWNLNLGQAAALIGTQRIVAVQWASPTSNPGTMVPGSGMTLKQANVDLSVARGDWFAFKPPAALSGVVVTTGLGTFPVTSHDGGRTWLTRA
jgi:hypothetical protein